MLVISVSNDHLELATSEPDEVLHLAQALFRMGLGDNSLGAYYISVTILRKALTNEKLEECFSTPSGDAQLSCL